jgi:hypothetical protein
MRSSPAAPPFLSIPKRAESAYEAFLALWNDGKPNIPAHRSGRALTNICLPATFQGECRYNRMSDAETGTRDLTVNGRKRGLHSITRYPFASRKSQRLV